MPCNCAFAACHAPDRQTRFGADLNTLTAADTAVPYRRFVDIRKLKADPLFPKWADCHTGPADTFVDPRVTGRPVDLGNAHIDIADRCYCQGIGWADLHALVTQNTGLPCRVNIRRVQAITALALREHYATWRTDFPAQAATDAGAVKRLDVRQGARQGNAAMRFGIDLRRQQARQAVRYDTRKGQCCVGTQRLQEASPLHYSLLICSSRR